MLGSQYPRGTVVAFYEYTSGLVRCILRARVFRFVRARFRTSLISLRHLLMSIYANKAE